MERTAFTHASRSSSHPLLQGRPYTPPPELPSLDGASSRAINPSSVPSLADRKAVSVKADIPAHLAQAMVDIVVVDGPGATPSAASPFLASPHPVCEEADELESGAPDPRAAFVRVRSESQEQPGSSVTWHAREALAPDMADLQDRKDQKAGAGWVWDEGVVAEPVVPQPQPQPLVLPLEVAAPEGVAGEVVAGEVMPRQGLCDKLAIGLRVGVGNAGRELLAGGLRVATHVSVAQAMEGAFRRGDTPARGLLGALGMSVGGLLAADTLHRLAGGRNVLSRELWAGMALASGLVPFVATTMTTSLTAGVALQSNLLGRLAGALVTETVMQMTDGVTARARLAAPPVNPLEPDPPASLRASLIDRLLASPTAYLALGFGAEIVAGPPVARVLEGLGLSAESAQAVVPVLPELCFALWDSIAMAAAASNDHLDLVLEPGQLSALAGNLRRSCETFSRIRELTGVRVLASSPLDFVGIGAAMHPGSLAMELAGMGVRHLSRIRGYLQQESRTPAGALDGVAEDFLAAHDAFMGSSGAGLDIRRHAGAFGEPDDLV